MVLIVAGVGVAEVGRLTARVYGKDSAALSNPPPATYDEVEGIFERAGGCRAAAGLSWASAGGADVRGAVRPVVRTLGSANSRNSPAN